MTTPAAQNSPIVIIDDDTRLLAMMETTLLSAGLPCPVLISDSAKAMEIIRQNHFSLALIDLVMPGVNGMTLLQQIKEAFPDMECIIVTAVNDITSAVEAMRYGAYDYLVKPVETERLLIMINRALEKYNLRREVCLLTEQPCFSALKNSEAFSRMIARDMSMAKIFKQTEAAAVTDYNVLITGESGTGKELLARILHSLSRRSAGPFVPVNMAAFPKALFEDSFFGHQKGAFTGAEGTSRGLLDSADNGTLFLDEITEMEPDAQAKLLRVIQEGEYYRLGCAEVKAVNVRFLAASNRDFPAEIQQGRFRQDLYFRLNMFHIHIPPLRERRDDIVPLANHFLKIHAEKTEKKVDALADEFIDLLHRHPLPGNVRQLESIIARAVLAEESQTLTVSASEELLLFKKELGVDPSPQGPLTLAEAEKKHIQAVLALKQGNRTHAARALGISLRTLHRKLNAFRIN